MASATARSISNTVSNTVSNNGPFSGTSTLQNVHNAVIGLPITREYGFVILSAAAIALQIPLQGISVGIIRGKLFDKAFFRTHFNMTDDEIPDQGYPDTGNGKYSDKLTLGQWQEFNNYQRAHLNYVEVGATTIALTLLSGIFYPRAATLLAVTAIAAREVYAIGYRKSGPKGRTYGAALFDLAAISMFGLTVYGAFNFAGGFQGVKNLFRF